MRPLTISCLQTRPQPDFDMALAEAMPLARQAVDAGAQILFLPEYCGGLRTVGAAFAPPFEREEDHPFIRAFQDLAAERSVWIVLGSVAVSGPGSKYRNRGILIDAQGRIGGRYDKLHLFDVTLAGGEQYCESRSVEPGDTAVTYKTPFGVIGHTICYDLRFPLLYHDLAKAGADIICCPAAFTRRTGEAHWHILNRARAIENGCFIVSPCATGPVPGGGETFGHSLIVDPWGRVLADGGTKPGIATALIDLDQVQATRAAIPNLTNERSYGIAAR